VGEESRYFLADKDIYLRAPENWVVDKDGVCNIFVKVERTCGPQINKPTEM
jgi:hypothetical protein